ncbi:uncharacterized protein [Euphorbia lathyris]|uniref:uncharacterized protein n=1 Tax=Euphorbia lathyris TaxID=212925 RepID=UPI0033130DC7
MASSPPTSPSPSNSDNSATHSTPSMLPEVDDAATKNGVPDAPVEKLDLSHFRILDSTENMEKYKKYEAEYTRRLMGKYFSKKNLYGGNIFDDKMTIDGETIMSSRWPSTRTFADPVKCFEEQSVVGSTSET